MCKYVQYYTLGCRLNFAETSTLAHRLAQMGFTRAPRELSSDTPLALLVVNTCAVTETATAKSRQILHRLIGQHPEAYVIVTGCYAQIDPEALLGKVKGIDLIVGTEYKGEHISELLTDLHKRPTPLVYHTPYQDIHTFHSALSADDRTRHFLKIQDGCNYFCSYCTIPMARGKSRSTSIASLVDEAQRLAVSHPGSEIVLTGVNIGDFGHPQGETFFDLCQALDRVEGIERYRIGSIEPNLLTDPLLDWIAHDAQRFAPHFHIPLQAGSDAVLRLMRRRYDTALFARKIARIRTLLPDAFIGVDVMAGMRGETEALFEEGYRFLQSLPVCQLHPFTYSERTGTAALHITPVVPLPERHARTARLVALSEEKLSAFYQSQQGTTHRVLWEETPAHEPLMVGFTENYIRLYTPNQPALAGHTQTVTVGQECLTTPAGPALPAIL